MKIYVHSCGVEQDRGYRWVQITANGQKREEPPLSSVIDLIDMEKYSIAIVRLNQEELLLLLTAIEAQNSTGQKLRDIFNRQIYISVAFVAQNYDEVILRQLAVWSLDEEKQLILQGKINAAVTLGGLDGFQVSSSKLQELLIFAAENQTGEVLNEPPELTKKVGKMSTAMKQALAEELKKVYLPREQIHLVIVTEFQTRDVIKNAGVWRGLSSLVDTEGWENISANGWLSKIRLLFNFKLFIFNFFHRL